MTWALQTAARTLWQECRGETDDGKLAVAWVLRNRLASGRWGQSLASVCLWRAQFSGWYVPSDPNFAYACGLTDDDPMVGHMLDILAGVMSADPATDPTAGALFYHANSMPTSPGWASSMTFLGVHGTQSFYTDRPKPGAMTA